MPNLTNVVVNGSDHSDPINIGTGREIKIVDLAYLIAKLVCYEGAITFNGQMDGQPRRCLDVSRAKELLGWTAKTSLEELIQEMIEADLKRVKAQLS